MIKLVNFTIKNDIRPHKVDQMRAHIRQAITITGLGIPSFENALDNIEKIQVAFITSIGGDEVEPLQPGNFQGHLAIDAHNRYFTKRWFALGQESHAFDPMTDPYGVLASLQNSEYVHIEDNHVDYLGPKNLGGTTK